MTSNLPQGYTCPKCQTFHKFVAYVYAHWHVVLTHWHVVLTHPCSCGNVNHLFAGELVDEDHEE